MKIKKIGFSTQIPSKVSNYKAVLRDLEHTGEERKDNQYYLRKVFITPKYTATERVPLPMQTLMQRILSPILFHREKLDNKYKKRC